MKINIQGYDVECTPKELVEFLILQNTVDCDCGYEDFDDCGLCNQCACELDYECSECNEDCQCDECNSCDCDYLFDPDIPNINEGTEMYCSCEECRANGVLEELNDELDQVIDSLKSKGIKITFN